MYFRRLKDLRTDKDYTQKEIAEFLKIGRTQYNRYENGIRDIPIDLLIKLAKLYDTSIDYLVGNTNVQKRYPENKNK